MWNTKQSVANKAIDRTSKSPWCKVERVFTFFGKVNANARIVTISVAKLT
ncbi:predicted Fe-S oxidoreductase [Solibacillus silvestris StLB046]|uniref:Predicted Fe-S oxidoreductase n=1 Tax=Solibacillus silvestris (strain StLB046) TaxID=1002809 RepID=F2F0V0_SOLSS|nr:predicted Fe-S oxidoreductase [Solibacillus silvestris StLB046]